LFLTTVGLSLVGFLAALAFAFPETWQVQTRASPFAVAWVFVAVHLVNSPFEFLFHRWVLHAPLIPFLSIFYEKHTLHHALTRVAVKRAVALGETPRIENWYPITKDIQHQVSFFPWYAFLVFGSLWTPVLAVVQWLLPETPVFLGGFIAIAWSLTLYEIIHMFEHVSLEKWRPFLDHPRFGGFWRMVYGFHLRHHADTNSNETVSGFFGLPIADLAFGTFVNYGDLYRHGATAWPDWFKSPTPRFFIRWIDAWAERAKQKYVARQRRG
jgi:hemolysin III